MNCKNKSFLNKRAFTLIELLIVIAIIGILFIVLVSKVDFATDKAKATGVQTDFRSFQMAFDTVAREQAGFSGMVDDNYENLEAAINKNLDNALKIDIDAMGKISMVNGTTDPWKVPYHGEVIVGEDNKDRGAIVMYSNGANLTFGSKATIADGVVTITTTNDAGKDDFVIVSCYSLKNGFGSVTNTTVGFGNNQTSESNQTDTNNRPKYEMVSGSVVNATSPNGVTFRSNADFDDFVEVKLDGNTLDRGYHVYEGSTVVVFDGYYINSLESGQHTVEIVSRDGSAIGTLNVNLVCSEHIDEVGNENSDYDGICDTCGIVFCEGADWPYCKDNNGDCYCDWCGIDDITFHSEFNNDGYCDACNRPFCNYGDSPCIDDDGDCICKWCGEEAHSDKNKNGYCDNCEAVFCYDIDSPCIYNENCTCTSCGNTEHKDDNEDCVCDNNDHLYCNGFCHDIEDLTCMCGGCDQ